VVVKPVARLAAQRLDPAQEEGWSAVINSFRRGEFASESDLAPAQSRARLIFTEATHEGQGPLCLPRYSTYTSNTTRMGILVVLLLEIPDGALQRAASLH